MQFRWDKWLQGVIASGVIAVVMTLGPIVGDGITKAELWMLLSAFIGGVILFCKDHPPDLDD